MSDVRIKFSLFAERALDEAIAVGGRELETGGALFGFVQPDQVLVHAVSGPGPRAVRESRYFLRDLAFTQLFARRIFADTGAEWIGEWHTHPHGPVAPSARDNATYVEHLHDDELNLLDFISVIILPGLAGESRCVSRYSRTGATVLVTHEIGERTHRRG